MVLDTCGNRCSKTCRDYRTQMCTEPDTCMLSCMCPNGTLYDNGTCVQTTDCACYDYFGNMINPGERIIHNDRCESWYVYTISFILNILARVNSVDPNQMALHVASDQGLHCLPLNQQFSYPATI